MSNFEDVKKFMKTFGQQVVTKPQFPDEKTVKLRFDLIQEELNELQHAIKTKDLKEVADALTDILYVTYGAGCAFHARRRCIFRWRDDFLHRRKTARIDSNPI